MAATRRLAAILAADVAGYSRQIGSDEQATLRRLKAIRAELVDPGIAAHHGRIVKTTGDGLLAEFGSTVDALRCAGDIQAQMPERNAAIAPDNRIAFRIGIHQGDIVVEDDGDIFGDGVNIAARLEALAEPSGICVSARVQEDAAGKLDLAFRDLGEEQLKNIARPVRAFAVGAAMQPPKRALRRRGIAAFIVAGAIAAAAIAAAGWWAWPRLPAATALSRSSGPLPVAGELKSAPRLSIVVLPFANLSGDPEQGYFADGITEDVTTDLSRVKNLLVIARNTAFTYKDKAVDVKQIGRELDVRYVIEGSVRRSADQVRVNAQLVDAETGAHLWAERFDHELGDLFALENEVTARIANTLGWELIGVEAGRPTEQPEAFDYILRGRAAEAKGDESLAQAIGFYERALALDPRSVEARGRLANALVTRARLKNPADAAPDLQRAEDLITLALAASPGDATGHYAKGRMLRFMRRCAEAIPEFEAAVAANRNDPLALKELGACKYLTGDSDHEVIALFEQAIRVSPRDPFIGLEYFWIGVVNLMESRTDKAILWLEKSRTARPKLQTRIGSSPPPMA